MLPWAAASAPSAPNRQFVTACDVSTLPATTAAGYSGDSIDFFGITLLIGGRQPPFLGISYSTTARKTQRTAARGARAGGLEVVLCYGEGAGEVSVHPRL